MPKLFRAASFLLATVAILLGEAQATAGIFTISGGVAEAVGDRGGTDFLSFDQDDKAGRGLPTVAGHWADTPSFSPDVLFGNARGISGYTNYGPTLTVTLNADRLVHFYFLGIGDALLQNKFLVDSGSGYQELWPGTGNGLYNGNVSPFTYAIFLQAGTINFKWVTYDPSTLPTPPMMTVANGTGAEVIGYKENGDKILGPSFFAGFDPYSPLARSLSDPNGPQRTGDVLYLGLSDGGRLSDHDYQDLGVRLEAAPLDEIPPPVPEPATLTMFLIGLGAAGCWTRGRAVFRRPTKTLS